MGLQVRIGEELHQGKATFAEARQRLGKFGLQVHLGVGHQEQKYHILPFFAEQFQTQNKTISKQLLNPTRTNKKTINNGRVRIFPNTNIDKEGFRIVDWSKVSVQN